MKISRTIRRQPDSGNLAVPALVRSSGRTLPSSTGRALRGRLSTLAQARFVRAQVINTRRNAAALRPFRRHEFGGGPASPSPAHITAANQLIERLRRGLLQLSANIEQEATANQLPALLQKKQSALANIKSIERVWDFYLQLFNQRQLQFADWLLATDRIALDCYQAVYLGLDLPRSIPSPPPFSAMETGHTPATFRRGVIVTRLGRQPNPFPLIQLPYHRLVNPWTLGAVHHEVSHNLQSDLGLWHEVPRHLFQRLSRAGLPASLARIWARWHKEIWADLCGVLLGGPAIVASLLDVLANTPATTLAFNPAGVHPTPYLRALINVELLRRMGFAREGDTFQRLWMGLYPVPQRSTIPPAMLRTFAQANVLVVDTICFQPYRQLGNKSLANVVKFTKSHQQMTDEAAQRLATGVDPGIIPARFLVAAARTALDEGLASPDRIAANFYKALNER